jgi:hypothetical protein
MNDKDKEEFEKWYNGENNIICKGLHHEHREAWQAAYEYKDKEFLNGSVLKVLNEKYESEVEKNKILVEALEKLSLYVSHNGDTWVKERATEALKKYRGEI